MIVANFESMVEAANKLLANVIYMPDLSPATEKIKASVYKCNEKSFRNHEYVSVF